MNYLIPHLPLNSPVNIGHHRQKPGTSAKALTTSASDGQLESRQPNGNPSNRCQRDHRLGIGSNGYRNPRPDKN